LSWQYHQRAETCKEVDGIVGIVKSYDDTKLEIMKYRNVDIIGLE
jgi:hypothetical protein